MPKLRDYEYQLKSKPTCRYCGKISFPQLNEARELAKKLTQANKELFYAYRHHGKVHLTTQTQMGQKH